MSFPVFHPSTRPHTPPLFPSAYTPPTRSRSHSSSENNYDTYYSPSEPFTATNAERVTAFESEISGLKTQVRSLQLEVAQLQSTVAQLLQQQVATASPPAQQPKVTASHEVPGSQGEYGDYVGILPNQRA